MRAIVCTITIAGPCCSNFAVFNLLGPRSCRDTIQLAILVLRDEITVVDSSIFAVKILIL